MGNKLTLRVANYSPIKDTRKDKKDIKTKEEIKLRDEAKMNKLRTRKFGNQEN